MSSSGEITSQGMRREEALIEAKQPHVESTAVSIEDNTASSSSTEASTSVLGGLWSKIRVATEAVAQMAQGAAVSVEHAGEKLVEQTKELALEVEHQVEIGAEKAAQTAGAKAEQLLELGSDLQVKAQSTLSDVSQKLHDLSEVVVEQGEVVGAQVKAKTSDVLASDVAQTVMSVGNSAVEQAKVIGQQALAAGQDAIDRTKSEGVSAEVKDLSLKTMSAGELLVEQAQAILTSVATQAKDLVTEGVTPLSRSNSNSSKKMKKSASSRSVDADAWNGQPLVLTMDVVSHIQRIADRTGDAVLHETARKAHSACAKGLNEAPGVHLVWITPQQANDLVNLAIRTQDHELADFARYCQSVAATTHIGVEPSPGKIQQEVLKGYQELQSQGRVHTGPGYGAAFASVNRTYANATTLTATSTQNTPSVSPAHKSTSTDAQQPAVALTTPPTLALTMDVVSHIQRIADRTGNALLHDTARKAHSTCAKGLSDAPGVHLVWITPVQASELMNLASRTLDQELIDFARYCQSVAATTQVGVEPAPGKIQAEILKGRQDVEKKLVVVEQPTNDAVLLPTTAGNPSM